ncbi:MAG: sugar phosphate isomerase/epimerase [Anaerolineae bacterium]|nr:sugar phosphate isomerase/epimerase [Anaerolineales bacterium]MCQ3978567.1 sugar phosphate isomerase/epimerase [Anaerolineae bacterium]
MFLSMHNWMRAEPIDVTIRRLAKYGYDSIEIEGEPKKYNTKEVRQLLKEHHLNCFGSVSLMFEGRDLIHADEAVRASTVQYLKDCITMVKELEGREMTIVPSQVGKVKAMASPEEEWAWAVEGLKEIYAHSEQAGVVLGLEPLNRFETNFLNRHDQAILLANEVGPNCGVCLDAFHINIEEADLHQAILNTGKKLVAFHVADNNRMACGQGDYDWVRLVTTLKAAGYDSALTVEFVAPLDRTPANPYKNAMAAAEAELTPEQLKFIEDHGSGVLSDEFYSWLVEISAKTLKHAIEKAEGR